MAKRSLNLIAAFVLAILLVPAYYYSSYVGSKNYFEKDVENRKRSVSAYLTLAKAMVETKQEERLMRILDEAVKGEMFDWYLISYRGEPVLYAPEGMEKFKIPEIDGNLIEDKDITSLTILLKNNSYLTIGINKKLTAFIEENRKRYMASIIERNGLLILLVIGIFSFLLKDIFKVMNGLRSGKGLQALRNLKSSNSLSREGKVFSEIMQGFQQSVDKLSDEKEMFKRQVLPSMRSELSSGRTPPYEFDCVMVRTDINRYSEMFSMGNRHILMAVINQFFTEATVIVSRYGGYVHEFVGDELIFYLKDEEHVNSVSMALSCILEIQDSTLQYQSEIKRVYQMPFTIKSSVSVGKLRYGPLVNGFSLMGPPLIESVRVLSLVDDRNKNQLFVPENVKERAFQIFGFEEKGYYLLKGYNHDRLIFELNSRRGLSRILEELRDELVPLLTCFRSPREIFHVINFLAVNGNISVSLVMRVLGVYRDVYTLGSYPEIREALVSLVRRYRGTPQAEKVTPTVIKLMQNLVAKDIYDSSMKELFTESLNVENERGIANTLEVFGHYEDLDIYELYNRFKDSGSARVIGNILVMWGKREVNKDLREIFHERLMSGNPQIVASCLYAFAEILFYWRQKDIVYIRSQIEFVELERDIRKIGKKSAYSGDEPIQRQIQRANNSLEKLAA